MALGPGEIPLGLAGLYIAGVLFVNLLAFMGKADTKDAAIFNVIVGFLATATALYNWLVFGSPLACAQSLLFAVTYFWLGLNFYKGVKDQRALGWYCLFVAINVIPFAAYTFNSELWILGINWILWGMAWFMFYVILGAQKSQYFKAMLGITWVATIVLWFCALGWLIGWMDFAKWYGFI